MSPLVAFDSVAVLYGFLLPAVTLSLRGSKKTRTDLRPFWFIRMNWPSPIAWAWLVARYLPADWITTHLEAIAILGCVLCAIGCTLILTRRQTDGPYVMLTCPRCKGDYTSAFEACPNCRNAGRA